MRRRNKRSRSCGKGSYNSFLCNPCFNKWIIGAKCSWEEALCCLERLLCKRR